MPLKNSAGQARATAWYVVLAAALIVTQTSCDGCMEYRNGLKRTLLLLSSPSAGIQADRTDGILVGEEVFFRSEEETGLDDPANLRYSWDFGDNSMRAREGRSMVHAFMRPGTFTVTLTISGAASGVVYRTVRSQVTVIGDHIKLPPRPDCAPLASYSFEDALDDSSGHGLHGVAAGGPAAYSDGAERRAISLDGSTYVEAADTGRVIGGSSGLTVSFRARKHQADAEGCLVSYPGLFSVQLRDGGQWLLGQVTNAAGTTASAEPWYMGANDTNWHHYVLVYNGSQVTLYFDGRELLFEDKCPMPLTGPLASSGDRLYIGTDSPSGTPFDGDIDEVRIYDRALTLAEASVGFELWHADYHARTAQYIYAQVPGEATRDAGNRLVITVTGDNGHAVTLADRAGLRQEERVLLANAALPSGNYTVTAELRNASGAVLDSITERFAKPYDGAPPVGIDENNAFRVNGELFFPVTPCGLRNFEIAEWAEKKYINLLEIQGFWGMAAAPLYTSAGWIEYMDTGAASGLLALGPGAWGDAPGEASQSALARNADTTVLENYVVSGRDNAGLFGWIWRDEPELGDEELYLPAEVVRAWTNRTHANDARHPVAINMVGAWIGDSYPSWWYSRSGCYLYKDNAGRFGRRTLVADIYSMDYYPIEFAAPHSQNRTMRFLPTILDAMRARTYNLVPCTSWVETCDIDEPDGGVRHPTPWHPTPEQLRMLIWINVVHGMKGINWFPWHSGTPDANYPVMSGFVDQITRLTPVVLGPEMNPAVTVTAPSARIDTMVRQYGGRTYLFAVRLCETDAAGNSIGTAESATIRIDGVTSTGNAEVFDEGRTVTVTGGELTDTFAPDAVHIYVIP